MCVASGATHITVVPILLLTANHAKEDIPLEIETGMKKYADVSFTYGSAFGIQSKIIDSFYERMLEQRTAIANDATVLLVGRGSSVPADKHDLTMISNLMIEIYAHNLVNV